MIQIEDKLISEEIFSEKFLCDIVKCNGICCVEGDSGAPLEESETEILSESFPKIKNFLSEKGLQSIEKQGVYVVDFEGEIVTPLVNSKECAYAVFENGTAKCAMEKAFEQGLTNFPKPISCHLYPIRIKKYKTFTAINYDKLKICECARDFGKKLNAKVYQFLKAPLIRKYGEEFYQTLCKVAEEYERETKKEN